MDTIDKNANESVISSEAYSLLDCFVEGLDDVVYEIAEEIARERTGIQAPRRPVRIEAEDVKQAAARVVSFLQELVKSGRAPAGLGDVLERLTLCLGSK